MMPRLALLLPALCLILSGCDGGRSETAAPRLADNGLLVGTGMANHDPVAPVCVGGGATFCGRRVDVAEPGAINDPLLARAAAITGENGETVIFVTTTNIGYFLAYKVEQGGPNGIYDMRLRIAEATGVRSTNIVVVSDHSHNGPDTIGIWGGVEESYLEITADAVVSAAVEAYDRRRPARLAVAAINQNDNPVPGVPQLDSSYEQPPGLDLERGNPANEFRLLVAKEAASGEHLLSLINYAPHATVWNGVATDKLTGDWAAWGPQEAEAMFGGFGMALIGSVGATDWNKASGEAAEREAEARSRLRRLLSVAKQQLQPVSGQDVAVDSVFIREPITQPILLLNYKPRSPLDRPDLPSEHFDLRIDRSTLPPFLQGTVFGTYVSAIRVGDVFFSTFPGEPFGELEYAVRRGVEGARVHFLFGGANDFFGYMVKEQDTYLQAFQAGATWLLGCPEQELVFEPAGIPHETGCNDHWALMVSPSFGSHIVCTLQDAAARLGFTIGPRDQDCAMLTALDGLLPPAESGDALGPATSPLGRIESERRAAELAGQCPASGAPAEVCAALTVVP